MIYAINYEELGLRTIATEGSFSEAARTPHTYINTLYICVSVCVCVCEEKLTSNPNRKEGFIEKQGRHYSVSVLQNRHQDTHTAILNKSWRQHQDTHTAILNKSWRQHPIRHQLYGHLPPITKTLQVRRTRHAGYSAYRI